MSSPGRRSADDLVARLANILAIVSFVTEIRGIQDVPSFLRGRGGPVVAIALLYGLVARRRRHAPAPRLVAAFLFVSAVLLAQLIVREHVSWRPGLGRWAAIMAPIVVLVLPAGSVRCRNFLRSTAPGVAKAVTILVACAVVAVGLVVAGDISRNAVHTLASGFSSPPSPPKDGQGVVNPPQASRPRRFPAEHSRCAQELGKAAVRPNGIDELMWSRILLEAANRPEWGLCRVAGVAHGSDGTTSVRLFSREAGPESYILARDNGEVLEVAFIQPQAGQLYYQQPGGTDMVEWGIPMEAIPCGKGGRLSIFRGPDGSVTGFSRWSREITPATRGTLTAYFTPANVALPLLTVLEASQKTLPLASGRVTGTGSDATQIFDRGSMRIVASQPSSGTLTVERLIAAC